MFSVLQLYIVMVLCDFVLVFEDMVVPCIYLYLYMLVANGAHPHVG